MLDSRLAVNVSTSDRTGAGPSQVGAPKEKLVDTHGKLCAPGPGTWLPVLDVDDSELVQDTLNTLKDEGLAARLFSEL